MAKLVGDRVSLTSATKTDGIDTPALRVEESQVGAFFRGRNGLIPIGIAGRLNVLKGPVAKGLEGATLKDNMDVLNTSKPCLDVDERCADFAAGIIRETLAGIRAGFDADAADAVGLALIKREICGPLYLLIL